MRPPELDVTLRIYQLDCKSTEDSGGDEPYMWILAFKVDAETMVDQPASFIPLLGVKIIEGVPASPYIKGTGEMNANESAPVPAALGTRWMRLKPALLKTGDWFPGIAGMICLLFDQDNFDPGTAEAGFKAFKKLFAPALSTQLNALVNGEFDVELSKDANGNVTGNPNETKTLEWRFTKLRDSVARKHAVKAITDRVKDDVLGGVTSAVIDEAGLDELLDQDDQLGLAAQVFLGDELTSLVPFSLRFTEDDADYTARGQAFGARVYRAKLDSAVTKLERVLDRDKGVWLRVCWFDMRLYWATAYRQQTTTRFELRPLVGGPPASVRWFLDDIPLPDGQGSVGVTFAPVGQYAGPPQNVLAPLFAGGPGTLTYHAAGSALEISNTGGDGVFFGKVRALYAYPGDPSLFEPGLPTPLLLKRGYLQEEELGILAVKIEMNDDYKDDVRRCMQTAKDIDLKQIEVDFGTLKDDLGNPPPLRQELLDRMQSSVTVAKTVVVEVAPPVDLNRRIVKRGGGDG
jgi:hypothetical protein